MVRYLAMTMRFLMEIYHYSNFGMFLQIKSTFQSPVELHSSVFFFQFSLFLHPDQAQNTLSGIQGQEATAVIVIYVTAPTLAIY